MKVITVKCLNDNFSYIVLNEENNYACVIDPSEAKPIINIVKQEKINLRYILNTHHHHDHVGGNLELKKMFGCKVLGFINVTLSTSSSYTFWSREFLPSVKNVVFLSYII